MCIERNKTKNKPDTIGRTLSERRAIGRVVVHPLGRRSSARATQSAAKKTLVMTVSSRRYGVVRPPMSQIPQTSIGVAHTHFKWCSVLFLHCALSETTVMGSIPCDESPLEEF